MNNLQHMYLHHFLLHSKQVAAKVELIKALPEWLPPKMGLLRIEDPESKTLSFVVLVMFPSCLTYTCKYLIHYMNHFKTKLCTGAILHLEMAQSQNKHLTAWHDSKCF